MKKIFSILMATSVMAFAIAGCSTKQKNVSQTSQAGSASQQNSVISSAPKTEGKLKVVASFYPLAFFAEQIGGEYADVVNLVPAGTEPHDWEPTSQDLIQLNQAQVFAYNGAGMENWVKQFLETNEVNDIKVVETSHDLVEDFKDHVSEVIGKDHDDDHDEHHHDDHDEDHDDHHHEDHDDDHDEHHHDDHDEDHDDHHHEDHDDDHDDHHHHHHHHHHHDGKDPHVWLSPEKAKEQMKSIANAMMAADPAHKDVYKANKEKLEDKFEALHEAYKHALEHVKQRHIVTTHAAFGYLCDEYHLEQVSINGLSPSDEPDPESMADIIKFIKENGIKTIFFETLTTPKVAQTIADETGANTDVLNPIEGLTEEEIKAGENYFTIMMKNLEALKKALK